MGRFKNGHFKRRRWPFYVLFATLAVFAVGLALSVSWYQAQLRPLDSNDTAQIVTIGAGASTTEIAQQLERSNLIRSATAFEWYVRINQLRDDLQAGSYSLSGAQSVSNIVATLVSGDVAVDLVTILPAQRLDQIRQSFIDAGFSANEVDVALNPNQYTGHPVLVDKPPLASLEGYLYAESFQKTADTPLQAIIEQSLDLMEESFTPKILSSLQEKGLDKHQAITLASIVEREVSSASGDRPQVAQVYLKRLSMGMKLEADPTAKYGVFLATGETTGWRQFDSPYNTYLYEGLPPGPIANVSYSSLEAVAFPASGDYVYFVAGDPDENGVSITYFSRTLEEHEALTRQYCIELCASY